MNLVNKLENLQDIKPHMNHHWPNQQNLELNLAVAHLFVQTYDKLNLETFNYTEKTIPIDIIDSYKRKELFIYILIEVEILVLDIIEINLSLKDIRQLSHRLLYSLISKVTENFFINNNKEKNNLQINDKALYIKVLFNEQKQLTEKLLTYLIFGSNNINDNIFPFYYMETPKEHVILLFENFIIQISNLVMFNFINNIKSLPETARLLIKNKLCNVTEISLRSISIFKNNLVYNNWLSYYFYYPKQVYNSKYKIWLLSSRGLISKYIYMDRSSNYLELSQTQLFCILCLELQDFVLPKIQTFVVIIGKLVIYILINILGKSLKICFKSITGIIQNIET